MQRNPEANRRGITRPFSPFPGYRARRPSFGRPVVIVLLDKNFHLAAWHVANSCMKHMCSQAADAVARSHLLQVQVSKQRASGSYTIHMESNSNIGGVINEGFLKKSLSIEIDD